MTRLLWSTLAAAVAALALSATAMAQAQFTPRFFVNQTSYAPGAPSGTTEIGVVAAREQSSIAKITIYAPPGYVAALGQAAGTQVGTAEAQVQAREIGENAILNITGTVVVGDQANATVMQQSAACTGTTRHEALLVLALTAAGTQLNVPMFVDRTTGAEAMFSSLKLQLCLPSPEIPSSQGGAAFGAKILEATLNLRQIFTNPAQRSRYTWRALFTPYVANTGTPNPAGTVESRGLVSIPTTVTLTARYTARTNRYRLSGTLTEATVGGQVARVAGSPILIVGGSTQRNVRVLGTVRTNRTGAYSFSRRLTPRRTTLFIAARPNVDVACGGPQVLPVPCVRATVNDAFSAVRRVVPRRRR